MLPFPKITDALQEPGAGYLPPRAREIYRQQVAELFEDGNDRLTPSTWFTRYCVVRRIRMRDVKPLASDVREAGLLLAQAVQNGWIEPAAGPRGGQGWRLTPAGRAPLPERPAKPRRSKSAQLSFPAQPRG